jgi:DNA uptake protein ComE-like DNA-binding protein
MPRPKKEKKISPEDQEVLLVLNILKTTLEGLMKTIQEAVDEVNAVKTAQDSLNTKLDSYFTAVLAAFNRLEAKIAAGADAQPIVDALAPVKQAIVDKDAALDVKIAEAAVEGV